jgi:nicotinamidase/pyrazinamidase
MSKRNIQLLAIDCQNDFATNDPKGYKGSLYVTGADQDMIRLAKFINRVGDKIDDIHATLDSHRTVQVFNEIFWKNSTGAHPNPFTIISVDDVEKGVWQTTNPSWTQRGIEYVKSLAAKGRYPLMIWPYHTRIGSIGAALVPCISDALIKWERDNFAMVDYCVKGDYFFSEAYGALESEVPSPDEPATQLNTGLIETVQKADDLLIAGEALSHCVKSTVGQIADAFGDDNIKKFVLLSDCSSSVTGFEKAGQEFVRDMVKRGMRITTSTTYLA